MSATGPKPPPPPRSKKSRKPAPRPPSDRSNQLDPLGDPYGAAPSMASNPYGFDSYAPPKAKPPGGAYAPPPKPSGDPYGGAGGAYGGDSHRSGAPSTYDAPSYGLPSPTRSDLGPEEPVAPPPEPKKSLLEMEPETVIGETLSIEGKLRFERLLRLDGKFEGELISEGDLIVGPQGELVGDVKTMSDIVVFGKVIGNIAVDRVELCGSASIYGDITCKVLLMDPTVVLVGNLNINPFAPNKMAPDGSEVGGPKPEKAPEEPAAAADVEGAMFDDAPAAEPEKDAPAADAAEPPAAGRNAAMRDAYAPP